MQITWRNREIVKPAVLTPHHRLWISNLDLVVPCIHTPSVYFYRPDQSADFFDAGKLRTALAEALVPFYPLAGRLAVDSNGRTEIDCNDEGVLFVQAEATETILDDLGDFAPTKSLNKLIPSVAQADGISSFPLLMLQVTYFKCGGVSLGVGIHHYVVDASSGFHFINSWSNLARGGSINKPPFMERTLLKPRDPPSPLFPHVEYLPASSVEASTTQQLQPTSQTPTEASIRMFHLTKSHIESLRKKAAPSTKHLSTFSLAAAHVWRCVCLARGALPNDVTIFLSAADGRKRLSPPLPEGYFGNVLFRVSSVCTTEEVVDGAGAAEKIQDAIMRLDDEYCRSAMDYLELLPNFSMLERRRDWYKSNLLVTSWVNFPAYDANFGWGQPIFVGPGGISCEGLAILLPLPTKDGSFTLAIALQAEHMKVFEKLIFQIY